MKLELKPFDFQQAVARAGLRPDGTPIGQAVGLGRITNFWILPVMVIGKPSTKRM
jgi:hypothetical protein